MCSLTLRIMTGVLLWTICYCPPVHAQGLGSTTFAESLNRFLETDYAYFRSDKPDILRLELYYQVYNHGLQFELDGDGFTAEYKLTVTVDDNDGDRVEKITKNKRVRVATREKTRSRSDFRTSQINVELPAGKYKIKFRLEDEGSGKINEREFKVKLENLFGKRPQFSGVEFAQAFKKKTGRPSVFDKTDLLVIPSVTRTYGDDGGGRLAYYFEIYPGEDPPPKVIVETKVRHAARGLIYRDTLHLAMSDITVKQLREISLGNLVPGEYEMELRLLGRRNKKIDEYKQEFEVLWTQEGMIRNDWKTTIAQLDLIADPGELNHMKNLETVPERTQAFEDFWLALDPTTGTPDNEAKTAFYRRVTIANRNFRIMGRPGWRSDRGRVFIRYGSPDQIDDEPFAPNSLPYQIWHYYLSGEYRRYFFVDENQDGDYRLQFPYDGLYQRPDF